MVFNQMPSLCFLYLFSLFVCISHFPYWSAALLLYGYIISWFRFREESEMTALWVPHDSDFRHRFNFVQEHFPLQQRSVGFKTMVYLLKSTMVLRRRLKKLPYFVISNLKVFSLQICLF